MIKEALLGVVVLVMLSAGCDSTDYTNSTIAHPVGRPADLQRLDLSKYDVVTVVAFGVEPNKGIDPIYGVKFAADIFGRLKHDFGNLFTEVRFGNPEGKANELIVTGTMKAYSEGNVVFFLWKGIPAGKANLDADLVLRDGATQQTIFTADVTKLWRYGAQPKSIEQNILEADASVANTIARGRGWQPSQ
jgi:hypothetical protein